MNLPGTQTAHEGCFSAGCTVPGLQGLATSEPVEQKEPAGQSSHSSLLPRPGVLLYVPSAHGSAADAPVPQKEPATHSTQAVRPL